MIERASLTVVDYVVIVVMLLIPLGIGIFFAIRDAKKTTREEYLLGGRDMSMLPVALSIFVTFQSAISLIGMPTEVYQFGPMVFGFYIGICLSFIISYFTLTPLMHPLQLTSIYEYLEMRFQSRFVRLLSTITGMLQTFFYIVIALLAPGLALEAASGIPLWMSVVIVGAIGTVYTSVGGIKSVVWTDAFQTIIVFIGIVTVVAKTSNDVGGIDQVWNINAAGGRTRFDKVYPDPRIRHTWVGIVLGATFNWMSNLFAQSTVQRLTSLKTIREARQAMVINIPLNLIYGFACTLIGWCLYAYLYHIRCDPYQAGLVSNLNQMTPFFVLQLLHGLPGMAGLYMSALFSGALSTVSSGINSLAANTVEDILKGPLKSVSEKTATTFTKIAAATYGTAIIGMVYLAKSVKGPVTQMGASVFGVFGSCVLGMFLLGSTVPWANKYGVVLGGSVSLVLNVWIVIGSQLSGRKSERFEPVSSDQCSNSSTLMNDNPIQLNSTTASCISKKDSSDYGFFLYDISYEWYSIVGVVVCFSVGLVVSRLTRSPELTSTDPRLILPFFRKYWKLTDTHTVLNQDTIKTAAFKDEDSDTTNEKLLNLYT